MDLSLLNAEQAQAVLHKEGPLLVLAAAGTGKTRVITYRIARLIEEGVPPQKILAVTFTNKAAEEMRQRVESLTPGRGSSVWIHTFHGFCAKLLRQHYEMAKVSRYFTIYDQSDQKRLIANAMKECGFEREATKASMYASIISRAKDDLLDAGSYAIYAATSIDPSRKIAAQIYSVYQKKIESAGGVDFGDLLLKVCSLLKEHPSIREYYQDYFLHILVDEYQDTNHAQYIITKTLAAKHKNLCVVGDDDQSVYSWRGADIRNILEFERDFKETGVVTLEQNYRSTKPILEAAGRVINHNGRRKSKTLWTERQGGTAVRVQELIDEREEASWVVRKIDEEKKSGHPLSSFAIFYRTNAQSRSFEEALRRAGVPYRLIGAMRFYQRQEIKDALAYARILLNPRDEISLLRVVNVPPRGIGKTSLERLQAYANAKGLNASESFRDSDKVENLTPSCRKSLSDLNHFFDKLRVDLPNLSAWQAMARILDESRYLSWLEEESEIDIEAASRLANVQELLSSVKEYEERRQARGSPLSLGEYLEEISLQTDRETPDAVTDSVTLMTIHLAKGLEYPTVFLTGLEEGLFPIGSGNSSKEELEEERRLCYVGMTRAKEMLYLTHASTRRVFGQTYSNIPSRFIMEAQLNGDISSEEGRNHAAPQRSGISSSASVIAPIGHAQRLGANLRIGACVRHPLFGVGEVLEKSGSGETAKALVRFKNGRVTKLVLRYAPLEII